MSRVTRSRVTSLSAAKVSSHRKLHTGGDHALRCWSCDLREHRCVFRPSPLVCHMSAFQGKYTFHEYGIIQILFLAMNNAENGIAKSSVTDVLLSRKQHN